MPVCRKASWVSSPTTQGFFPCRGEDSRRPSKDSTGSIRSKSSAAWWIPFPIMARCFFFFGGGDIPHRNSEMLLECVFCFFAWALAGQLIDSKVQWKVGSNLQDGQVLLKHDSLEQGLELQGISQYQFFFGRKR